MVLEYKPIGHGWVQLQRYDHSSYDAPGWANPNGGSLGLWDGGSHNGFALYAVSLPSGARSAATKFRWRQKREMVSGNLALWVLDDVSIDIVVAQPAVQLSCPAHPHAHKATAAQLLTVVAQFSQAVSGFTAADVAVQNGTVVGLSKFNAKILGMGELYSVLVRPDGPPGVELFDVVVAVGGGACVNNRGHPNLGSNTLRIAADARAKKKHSRAEQALGMPRPGAGSLDEAMAARARILGDARFAQPLVRHVSPPRKFNGPFLLLSAHAHSLPPLAPRCAGAWCDGTRAGGDHSQLHAHDAGPRGADAEDARRRRRVLAAGSARDPPAAARSDGEAGEGDGRAAGGA